MTDLKVKILAAIKTGKVHIGSKEVINILLNSETKFVLLAHNCQKETRERILYYCLLSDTHHQIVKSNSMELGTICAQPYPVSALAISDPGESNIIDHLLK
ncbi:MAG: 50S ribosomal protein L30e [Candidatus Altiarchaeota archaeon]